MSEDDDKLARLPKWAQREIQILRRNVADLTAKLGEGPADSDTFLSDYVTGTDKPLGRDALIAFHARSGAPRDVGVIEAHIVERSGAKRLEVRCSDGSLVVRPVAANVISIEAPGGW